MIELDVAIVGGGFSGCAVAANLAGSARALSLGIFEPGLLGRGAAYGTRHPEHLLNTPARQMSLFSKDPDHFVRWLGPRGGPADFVSRRLYGDYLTENAHLALDRPQWLHVPDRVASLERSEGTGFVLESAAGAKFSARNVVLATGNPDPGEHFLPIGVRLQAGYVGEPWRFDYRCVGGEVLVIGSGLTALDVFVALKSSGHRARVHVLSRSGRYPRVHGDGRVYDVIPALDPRSARSLLRSFRRHLADASARGFGWRAVVDALRPESEAIWRRLSRIEQQRFERHLRAHWERHRHRAPQAVDAVRREYESSGRLTTHIGRLQHANGRDVTIALRNGGTTTLRPDWIVNCTGIGRVASMVRDPLLRSMLDRGAISPDAAGVGLRASWDLAAIDAQGDRTAGLWIVGPPVRGARFEATSVPELRLMAELAADGVLRSLRSHRAQIEPSVLRAFKPLGLHP
jgi:uncharacterized NAD(P)/FAD-binding protein YdhS